MTNEKAEMVSNCEREGHIFLEEIVDKSERKKAYSKLYYEIHKEEYHERYLKNREKILERNKANKEKKAEYDHNRNIEKFEELSDYRKTYYINHKEYFYEKNKEYRRKKRCV